MKKILILISLCLLVVAPVCSQTLHAIIFANTKSPGNPNDPRDTGIGPSVTVDFERMGIEMTSISSFIGYNLKKYYYYDTQERFSRKSLLNVLNNLACGKDDIVFFYYSGHGLRAENEETQYPEMVLKVPYGPASVHELYPLYDVYKKIKEKHPRLTIVMGDLCNSTIKGFYRSTDTAKGASVKSSTACDVYKNLFLNVKGGLIATSSKPGQTSGCAFYKDGTQAGGIFTVGFLECLGACVSQGQAVNWDTLLEGATAFSIKISEGMGNKQTPVYSTKDLVVAEAPLQSSTQSQPPTSDDTQTMEQDDVAGALSSIANDQNSRMSRIKNIQPTLSRYFASSQSMIQVVGRDSKTIVNTTTASSYLNYLSIATNMEQVMVIEEKKNDNGRISYLKVHEMHRE